MTSAMRDRPPASFAAFRGAAGWRSRASRWAAGCAALALMPALVPALSGCGAVASVGSTLYSASEAIATVVKDKMKEREGGSTEPGKGGPGHGDR